jgi:hypothetical protein
LSRAVARSYRRAQLRNRVGKKGEGGIRRRHSGGAGRARFTTSCRELAQGWFLDQAKRSRLLPVPVALELLEAEAAFGKVEAPEAAEPADGCV